MISWSRDARGLACVVAFVLALYWPAVSGQGFFFERDVWLYWLPHIEWAVKTMSTGVLPEWNPFVAFGAPFVADPSFQFFYPPSVLNWLVPPRFAYTFLVVGHSLLGGLGAYTLLRRRLRSATVAILGAVVFVGSGPLVSSANLWHHFSSAMYMPWVIDAFLRLRSGGRRGGVKRLAFLVGLQALAGSADACVMTGMGMVLLLPRGRRRLTGLIPRLAVAMVLSILLAAVQWVPTAFLASKTSRAGLESSGRFHWSVPPSSLIDFVVPFNGPAHSTADPDDLEEPLRLIQWMYMGASTLPLLVLGLKRSPRAGLILALSIVLAMGRHTPLARWVGLFPGIASFRFPSKLLWFVALCWATLAAIGLRSLIQRTPSLNRLGGVVGASLLILALGLRFFGHFLGGQSPEWQLIRQLLPVSALGLGGMLLLISFPSRTLTAAVPLLVAADLLGTSRSFNAYASAEMFTTRPAVVDELNRLVALRVYVRQQSRLETPSWKSPATWSDKESFYFGFGQFLTPPQSVRWGIKGSFDGDFTGLGRPEYAQLSSIVSDGNTMDPRWLGLAGVTHALRFRGSSPPEFPIVAEVPTFRERPVLVLAVPEPLPLAYVVERVRSEPSSSAAIRTLASPAFDPRSEIVRVQAEPSPSPVNRDPAAGAQARVVNEIAGRVVVEASVPLGGTLVVLNAFSEGWRATVDGQPRVVLPANLIFQSVDLDAGDHTVEFEYVTPGLKLGASLSAIAWVLLAVLSAEPRKKRS
jgi:hypothetical protein